jgi:hypothetical protein
MYETPEARRLLGWVRAWMAAFLVGLVLSGVTAFPLVWEMRLLARLFGLGPDADPAAYDGMRAWVALVQQGVTQSDARWPFLAYGTDWLAFGHLAIAVLFGGVLLDPVRNVYTLRAGMAVCVLIFPLAFVCGPIRGIPFFHQLIDCSFGVAGLLPLAVSLHLTRRIEALNRAAR